jgi:predicted transcriptional regulator
VARVKLFGASGWFPIHSAVFDVIMPGLSPDAWKALCVAIRETWGQRWTVTDADDDLRDGWGHISHSQFQEKMGDRNEATVSMALQECLEAGYLVRREIGEEQGKPAYVYTLNWDFEVVDGSEATSAEKDLTGQREVKRTYDGDGVEPSDRFLMATWRLATGEEISSDELEALAGLLEPGVTIGALASTILELGRRVDNVKIELVEAIVAGRIAMPPLRDERLPPSAPMPPVVQVSQTPDEDFVLGQVTDWYVKEIGPRITQMVADELLDLTETQRNLDVWEYAFRASKAAADSPIGRWRYITKVISTPDMKAIEDWISGGKKLIVQAKQRARHPSRDSRRPRTIKEKPPAEEVDAETRARQRAALAELRRRQREREQK